jgi:hypothetical protein
VREDHFSAVRLDADRDRWAGCLHIEVLDSREQRRQHHPSWLLVGRLAGFSVTPARPDRQRESVVGLRQRARPDYVGTGIQYDWSQADSARRSRTTRTIRLITQCHDRRIQAAPATRTATGRVADTTSGFADVVPARRTVVAFGSRGSFFLLDRHPGPVAKQQMLNANGTSVV